MSRPPHVKLRWNFEPFINRYSSPNFVRFRFVKYSVGSADDHIRLFCYALNSKENEHFPEHMIGLPFVLSKTNFGSIYETIPPNAIIYRDALAMDKDLIKQIFPNEPPRFGQLILMPKTTKIEDGLKISIEKEVEKKLVDIETYEIYVDDVHRGTVLNPSPPFFS